VFGLYIKSVMSGSGRGAAARILRGILKLISFGYALGIKLVGVAYSSGIRRVYAVPVAVVSVGNLTLGGTGKTPVTVLIASHFLSSGRKPAIITRGYGNDECRMLSEELPEVPVYTGQDRLKSALRAVAEGRDVVVLDDGFQHRRLKRDLDILLVDGKNSPVKDRIFPSGMLREPPEAGMRADLVIITKTDNLSPEKVKEAKRYADIFVPGKPVVVAKHSPVSFKGVDGRLYSLEHVKGRAIVLVSGIADPYHFETMVKSLGGEIRKKYFYPDHYRYRQEDINEIASWDLGAERPVIVTTSKDIVKMTDLDMSTLSDRVVALRIEIDVTEGKEKLIAGLDSVLGRSGR
jgi:tetraacyldisaccharide 4'-kinase